MTTLDEKEEAKIKKRIAKAEKKAMKIAGVDQSLIQRFWELVNMFPKISNKELEDRVERFIMEATPGQFFTMQQALFQESIPYLLEDPRVSHVMDELAGKKIGLSVMGEYESTVTLSNRAFTIERGIKDNIPVLSVASRRDYADAILGKKDPIRMILKRKIRATHKLTLLKWALPHIDNLRDGSLFDKYVLYQSEVEKVLDEELKKIGY